jgi:hypothetical protein
MNNSPPLSQSVQTLACLCVDLKNFNAYIFVTDGYDLGHTFVGSSEYE